MYETSFEVGKCYIIKFGYIERDETGLNKEFGRNVVFLVLDYREEQSEKFGYLCRKFRALFKEGITNVYIRKSVNDYEEIR